MARISSHTIFKMSDHYYDYRDEERRHRRNDYPSSSASNTVSRSRINSTNRYPPSGERYPEERSHYRDNERKELFPTDHQGRYSSSGSSPALVGRRVEELRGAHDRRDSGHGCTPSRPQRSNSAAGQKRPSGSEYDRPSKASRSRSSTVGRSRASTLGQPRRGDPSDPFRVTRDNCKPGTIIQAVLYEEAMDKRLISRALQGESSAATGIYRLGENETDGWFIRKNRPWIVTAVNADSYTVIPLHTHNGDGLEGKDNIPGLTDEYVGVQFRDQDAMSIVQSHSSMQRVLEIEKLYGSFVLHSESAAWLTYTVSRRYEGRANVIGRLRHSSVLDLMRMLDDFAPKRQRLTENRWEPTDVPSEPPQGNECQISATMGMNY